MGNDFARPTHHRGRFWTGKGWGIAGRSVKRGSAGGGNAAGPNSLRYRKGLGPGVGVWRAGDRIRTDDVQLGKRSIPLVQKPTEAFSPKSLRQYNPACKVMRDSAENSEKKRYSRALAGRNPVERRGGT